MEVTKKRWGYLALAVTILLFAGIGYAFSLFVAAIETDLSLSRADTSFIFTLCFICFAAGSLITGFLLQKFSAALLLRIGAVMILIGFFTSSKAVQLWQLYFTYSICCGLSIGIAYNIMISVIPLYFQDKVGLATGILLMGFAMSTTLLGPFCEKGLSVMGWRGVFLILGICEAAVFLAGSVGIHMPLKNQKEGLPEAQKTRRSRESLPPRRMLRRKSFYVFLTIYIAIGGVGMSLINHGAMTLQEDLGRSLTVSVLIVGIVCLFNGVGRVLWGIVYDSIGSARSLTYLGILLMAAMVLVISSLFLETAWLFGLGMALVMFCYGGSSSLAPIIVRALYGDSCFSANFAVTNIGTMILSSVPALIGIMQTKSGNYTIPYVLLGVFSAAAFLMACVYGKVTESEFGHVC